MSRADSGHTRDAISTLTRLAAFTSFVAFTGAASQNYLNASLLLVYILGAAAFGRVARTVVLRHELVFPCRAEAQAVIDVFVGIGLLTILNQVLVVAHLSSTVRRVVIIALLAAVFAARVHAARCRSFTLSVSAPVAIGGQWSVLGIVSSATIGLGLLILEPLVSIIGLAVLAASCSARIRSAITPLVALGGALVTGTLVAMTSGPLSTGIADGHYVAAIAQAVSSRTPLHHPFASGTSYSYHSLGYLVVGMFTEVAGLDPTFVIHVAIPAMVMLCTASLLWDLAAKSALRVAAPESVIPTVVGLTVCCGVLGTNSLTQLMSYPLLVLAVSFATTSGRVTSAAGDAMRVAAVAGLVGLKGPIGVAASGAFAAQLVTGRGRVGRGARWRSALVVMGAAAVAYAAFFGIRRLSEVPVGFRPQVSMFGFLAQSEFVADGRVAPLAGLLALLAIGTTGVAGVALRVRGDRRSVGHEFVRSEFGATSGGPASMQSAVSGVAVWFVVALIGCLLPYVFLTEVAPPATISTYFMLHAGLISWVAGIYDRSSIAVLSQIPRTTGVALLVAGVWGQAVVSALESSISEDTVAGRLLRAGGAGWVAVLAILACALPHVRRSSVLGTFVVVLGILSTGASLQIRSVDFGQQQPTVADDSLPGRYAAITAYFANTDPNSTVVATNRVCEPAELSCSPDGDPLISLASKRQMYIEGTGHVTVVRSAGEVAEWVARRVDLSRALATGGGGAVCRQIAAAGVTHYVLDIRVTPTPSVAPCLTLEARSSKFQIFRLE